MNDLVITIVASIIGFIVGLLIGIPILLIFVRLGKSAKPSGNWKALSNEEIDEIRIHLSEVEKRASGISEIYRRWHYYWNALLDACQKHNAIGRWKDGTPKFIIERPATEAEIKEIERVLQCSLPESFRRVLLTYSTRVEITWRLQDEDKPPELFRNIFSGECRWNLQDLPSLQKIYQGWIDNCFPNPDDTYDVVWHNKFPIVDVGNGDYIGIDLGSKKGSVIYLSHDDGRGHGYQLGRNFEDFIDRIAQIGCPGYEDWHWLSFTSDQDSMIDPHCRNARDWRQWFGLIIDTPFN
ncbi:MAG: SMI1/KNR4 family protein [Anaerolineales bacterium]|jgi:cell wall assembly regulator SMI1